MLSDLARLHWPELIPTPFPLLATNQWYMVTRYPDIEEEPPAASDVEEALLVLESLLASVLGLASGAAE